MMSPPPRGVVHLISPGWLEEMSFSTLSSLSGGVCLCRERSDGLYSTITYLLSKMVEELLVILFVSLTVSLCIFYAVGFHGQWILFWLVYLVTISIGMGESSCTSVQTAGSCKAAHAA